MEVDTVMRAMDATTSACRLAFRRRRKALPLVDEVSASDPFGLSTDSAAAFAVFKALSSVPPLRRIERAATIAV